MRLGVLEERAVLLHAEQAVDIAAASAGRFGPHPMQVYEHWDEFREWERNAELRNALRPLRERDLSCPVPEPGQIFAVGLNYAEHAAETRFEVPAFPPVFTKFRSALAGPYAEVQLPSGSVDWEVELVVVIGRTALAISCEINSECMQHARTSEMLFSVPELLVRISAVVILSPGDLIFTGTPAGVGMAREPQRWLQPGDVLRSHIARIGEMEQRFVAG